MRHYYFARKKDKTSENPTFNTILLRNIEFFSKYSDNFTVFPFILSKNKR